MTQAAKPPSRIDLLRAYIDRLAQEQLAAGKFAAPGANRIEAAVNSLLAGSGALIAQLWADLRLIGGEKSAMAAPIAETIVANAAADGARAAMDWAGGALKALFNGRAREKQAQRRAAGKAIMEGAQNMRRRG